MWVRLPPWPPYISKYNLNQAIEDTKGVCDQFPNPKKWGAYHRLADLIEEVGELANAIQTDEGYKSKKRKKSEVIDSICNIVYEVFMMAAIYRVDLDKEYPKVLKQIESRIKSGEFDR